MRAINHALTGATIGLVVGNPWVALPAALASHFACDALPHYGSADAVEEELVSKSFRNYFVVDAILCMLFVLILGVIRPENWLLAVACAFLAALPDVLWVRSYICARRGMQWRPSLIDRFAHVIQWFERPVGVVVEVAWFAAFGLVILPLFLFA